MNAQSSKELRHKGDKFVLKGFSSYRYFSQPFYTHDRIEESILFPRNTEAQKIR